MRMHSSSSRCNLFLGDRYLIQKQELVIFKGTVDILGNTLAFQRCKSTDSREKIKKL